MLYFTDFTSSNEYIVLATIKAHRHVDVATIYSCTTQYRLYTLVNLIYIYICIGVRVYSSFYIIKPYHMISPHNDI